ncbi:MAG: XRE family transcriptional regulator [bacterium]
MFAELGFDNPAEELAKAQLAMMIDAVQERHLTQQAAPTLMGVDQMIHARLLESS